MDNDELYAKIMQESLTQRNGCGQPMLVTIIIAIILMFSSCATKKQIEYVDREVVKYQKEVVHDTLLQHTHDSIYHTVFHRIVNAMLLPKNLLAKFVKLIFIKSQCKS